jgi:hypothetical protein
MRGQHPNSRANLRPDNLRGRRSPRMNLHRDGYEAVAEVVSEKARRNITLLQVHVDPDGGVYTSPERKLSHAPMLELVGTYNREVRVEHVEDDLIAWMREHNNQHAA